MHMSHFSRFFRLRLFAVLSALLPAAGVSAASEQPDVSFSAEPLQKQDRYYVSQTLPLQYSLTHNYDIQDLRFYVSQILRDGTADESAISVSPEIVLLEESPEQHRYRHNLRILKPGKIQLTIEVRGSIILSQSGSASWQNLFSMTRAAGFQKSFSLELPCNEVPAEKPENYIGVAGDYALQAALSAGQAAKNDLLTLSCTISGPDAALAKFPHYTVCDGITAYAPQPAGSDTEKRSGRYFLRADTPGNYELPPLAISVFDPQSGTFQTRSAGPWMLSVTEEAPAAEEASGEDSELDAVRAQFSPDSGTEDARTHLFSDTPAHVLSSIPVRFAPMDAARVLFTVTPEDSLKLREQHGAWIRILRASDHASGWIHQSALISPSHQTPKAP